MKKILFFDVDGTLYNSKKSLPASAKKALLQARENGHEIAIATGRAPFMIKSLLEELEINTYVTFNGQYVVYKGEVIYTDKISNEVLKEIIRFGNARNEPVVFLNEKEMVASTLDSFKIEESLATLQYPYPRVDPVFYEHNAVYQTLIFMEKEDEQLYKQTFPQVQFVRWHEYSCDILPNGGSKARGIEQVLKFIGKTMEDAIAFGDGLNDIEMLQAVGLGVAMENGHQQTKEVADIIAPHVDEDGIYKIMTHLQLI